MIWFRLECSNRCCLELQFFFVCVYNNTFPSYCLMHKLNVFIIKYESIIIILLYIMNSLAHTVFVQ